MGFIVLLKFNCSYSVRYIGHAMDYLSEKMSELVPARLRKGTLRNICTVIMQHLKDSGHKVGLTAMVKPVLSSPRFHIKDYAEGH